MTESATTVCGHACSRRAVLAGTGAVGAGVLLTACGSGGGAQGGGSGDGSPVTVQTSDVPVGGGVIESSARVVVTQPSKGEFKAFSAICTHAGCTVSMIQDGEIICPCHGSAFDIATGKVLNGPATSPLPEKSASVSGGEVTVS